MILSHCMDGKWYLNRNILLHYILLHCIYNHIIIYYLLLNTNDLNCLTIEEKRVHLVKIKFQYYSTDNCVNKYFKLQKNREVQRT